MSAGQRIEDMNIHVDFCKLTAEKSELGCRLIFQSGIIYPYQPGYTNNIPVYLNIPITSLYHLHIPITFPYHQIYLQ